MLSLLEILLQKIPSNSLSLLLDKAIQAGSLQYDIEFRTLYQKQAQKGFLFLIPYFMVIFYTLRLYLEMAGFHKSGLFHT